MRERAINRGAEGPDALQIKIKASSIESRKWDPGSLRWERNRNEKTRLSERIQAQDAYYKHLATYIPNMAYEMLWLGSSIHETIENRPDEEQSQTKAGGADNCERKNLQLQKFGKIWQDDENHCASAPPRDACGDQGGLKRGLFYEKFHQQSRLFWTRALLGVRAVDKAGNVGRRAKRSFLFRML